MQIVLFVTTNTDNTCGVPSLFMIEKNNDWVNKSSLQTGKII